VLTQQRREIAQGRVTRGTHNNYLRLVARLPVPPPIPFVSPVQLSAWLLQCRHTLLTLGADADRRLAAAWPAVTHSQRLAGGSVAFFADVDVDDLIASIRRLIPDTETRSAAPPSIDMMRQVAELALTPDLPPETRCMAAAMLLQFYSCQRPSVIRTITFGQIYFLDNDTIIIMRQHKTQHPTAKRQGRQEPTPPFDAPLFARVFRQLTAAGVINPTTDRFLLPGRAARANTPTQAIVASTYEDRLQDIWTRVGIPAPVAHTMTPHGLRRGGVHFYCLIGRPLQWILALGPWATLKSARPYLPPDLLHLLGPQGSRMKRTV